MVIDNCGAFGDATSISRDAPDGSPQGPILATSTMTSALIAQMLVTEACGLLLEAGQQVPVLISANIPGGDEHNDGSAPVYADRVQQGAP